jgi:hypothetical protein
MKYTIFFCLILLTTYACNPHNSDEQPADTSFVIIKQNKHPAADTLYQDANRLVVRDRSSTDTLLKFNPAIDSELYSVKVEDVPLPKKLDFSGFEYKRRYHTTTQYSIDRDGVNFAGHFCFVYWGCGSPCQMSAVVDLKTGKVYDGPTASNGYGFKKDSRLLIINPPDLNGWYYKDVFWQQPSLLLWTGRKFIALKRANNKLPK